MGYTKLDRANTAKVQQVTGVPGSSTVGNIAVSSTGPSLYFKYNSLWYAVAGATGGIFEEGTGTNSTKRANIATLTVSGDYSFGHAASSTISGDYSFGFGTNISLGGDYNLVTGSTQTINSASHYNAVFGYSHILNASANYNIAAGNSHNVDAAYCAFFGGGLTCSDDTVFYGIFAGRDHDISSCSYGFVAGNANTVSGSYNVTFGSNNTNTENYAIAHGDYVNTIWKGARHFSGVRMDGSTSGTSMGMDGLVLSAQTTGAETVDMTFDSLDGSGTNPLYIPDATTQSYTVRVVAVSSGASTGVKVYEIDYVLMRVDPNLIDVGASTLTTKFSLGSLGGTITQAADDANNKLKIQAVGAGGQTINWTAYVYAGINVQGSYQTGT